MGKMCIVEPRVSSSVDVLLGGKPEAGATDATIALKRQTGLIPSEYLFGPVKCHMQTCLLPTTVHILKVKYTILNLIMFCLWSLFFIET